MKDFLIDHRLGSGRLSGGQMRRVSIGTELAARASILLCDEPTSALDAVNTRLVVATLRALANSGRLELDRSTLFLRPHLSAYGGVGQIYPYPHLSPSALTLSPHPQLKPSPSSSHPSPLTLHLSPFTSHPSPLNLTSQPLPSPLNPHCRKPSS